MSASLVETLEVLPSHKIFTIVVGIGKAFLQCHVVLVSALPCYERRETADIDWLIINHLIRKD